MAFDETTASQFNRAPGCIYNQEEIDAILFPPSEARAFGSDTVTDIHREIKRLKRKRVDLELHGQTLSEYYRTKKIPRDFRISNQPTIGRHKREFCEKWCEVSTQNSLNYMLIVIEEVKVQLCQVNRELSSFEITTLDDDTQANALQTIDKEILAYSDKQKQAKRDKLRLVNQDYQEGRVYPWISGVTRARR